MAKKMKQHVAMELVYAMVENMEEFNGELKEVYIATMKSVKNRNASKSKKLSEADIQLHAKILEILAKGGKSLKDLRLAINEDDKFDVSPQKLRPHVIKLVDGGKVRMDVIEKEKIYSLVE